MPYYPTAPITSAPLQAIDHGNDRYRFNPSPESHNDFHLPVNADCRYPNSSNEPHDRLLAFDVRIEASARTIDIHYTGAVHDFGIQRLVEIVELGHSIYKPENITVHMRSPGGSARAIEYWVLKSKEWANCGRHVATRAQTTCASAAALMVTMGAVGLRSAHPLSLMLYHNPRLIGQDGSPLLEHDAEKAALLLRESRTRMHLLIKQHLTDSLGVVGFARTICARATWMLRNGSSLPPMYFVQDSCESGISDKWHDLFDGWANLRVDEMAVVQAIVSQWEEQLDQLFRSDRVCDLQLVWALLLIDETEHLPALIAGNDLLASAEESSEDVEAPRKHSEAWTA